jgi:integrase
VDVNLHIGFLDRSRAETFARTLPIDLDLETVLGRHLRLDDGTPMFFDGIRPAAFWFEFGIYIGTTRTDPTRKQYAYTALRFARFLRARDISISQARESDITDYRKLRLEGDNPISRMSWKAEATVIRLIFGYCVQIGLMKRIPWVELGRRNVLSQPVTRQPVVRSLTEHEWHVFRDIGLKGRGPGNRVDPAFAGKLVSRNTLGAQLALATGMRLEEFSTITLGEILGKTDDEGGVHVRLRSCAKGARERDIYIPPKMRARLVSYTKVERASLVKHLAGRTRLRMEGLFIVNEEDPNGEWVSGQYRGKRYRRTISDMSPQLRMNTFSELSGNLEPYALFVNSYGRMASKSSWHRAFNRASARVASFPATPRASGNVQPHTLRHTFARSMLAFLNQLRNSPQGIAAGYGEIDPLVEVQRMLGHASLQTTSIYLTTNQLSGEVERAFADWDNETLEFGDLIEKYLSTERSVRAQ